MDKIDRPRGLIRYDSNAGVIAKERRLFTPRSIAYSAVLLLLIAVNVILFSQRGDVELLIQRTPGLLYQEVDEDYVSNLYNYQVINKTQRDIPLEFKLADGTPGRIKLIGQPPHADPDNQVNGTFLIELERAATERRKRLTVEVYRREDGKLLDRIKTSFLGPNR
jgi:polyferredoxin